MHVHIVIQEELFDLKKESDALIKASGDAGALVLFQGMVREFDQAVQLEKMMLEHFPGVTEKEITRIILKAKQKWDIAGCRVIHRVGAFYADDPIVLLMVTAKHRLHAFLAAEYIMDYLKTEAPFWKKEFLQDGENYWVAAKKSDQEILARWQEPDSE
ncbi:molybdenum cofactor biosynthesis protein MoaE [Ignatzschineria rhizosphaerae]|uniref:Molybdopterin synthase catalytic subunit n=1 Tax=Ignatzschineria rhizosphaerae TaxID=2923279 RepID=A0ABY3WZQ2_9GAMM|nr:molybdenum cofactor biosynthesis protein MoaE [Ignatzschineria rhizosphaerae]UNM96103.1 molybdenum cofactor biosynthesis protein MoaE [Ignatzschineria rhizosphaerae]